MTRYPTYVNVDLKAAEVDGATYTFPSNMEQALSEAAGIFILNAEIASATYSTLPGYYNMTTKRLYHAMSTTHYWTVSGNTLTYV